MAAERILRKHPLYIGIESVEGFAHVHRAQCNENTRRRRKAEHVQPRSSARQISNCKRFAATDRQAGRSNNFHRPGGGPLNCRWFQADFSEYDWYRKIRTTLCFCKPPVQSRQRDSVLSGKGGARETTAPELLNHSHPLLCGCTMLPGICFHFHCTQRHPYPISVAAIDVPGLPLTIFP